MTAKTHSILTVVNAHADVDRSIRERADVDADPQSRIGPPELLPSRIPNRVDNRIDNRVDNRHLSSDQARLAPRIVSWGVLFGSEYIWAPDIGPMLIVCPNEATNWVKVNAPNSSNSAIVNCCILQFENTLSARRSLRIFYGY